MLLSIPGSPEDVYPLLRLSISTQNIIWLIFRKKVCQNKIDLFIPAYYNYASLLLFLLT